MRITILTNIPTPYRTAFYDALHDAASAAGDSLEVLYCAQTEPRRHWPYLPSTMRHHHSIMSGTHPFFRGYHTHFNPEVIKRLYYSRPDVVVVGGAWNTPTMLMAVAWCKHIGTPAYLWSEGHGDAVLNPLGPIAWLRRTVYSSFDGFLVPNSKSADWALRQSKESKPILSLPNSIDTKFFALPPGTSRGEWRFRLGLNQSGTILVQVARVDSIKAPLELAKAFLSLPADYRVRAKLVFVGAGALLEELRTLASESQGSIIVTGNIDSSKVREWLWASDVFVLNTKRDPNPLSPIEASSASIPILVSHLAGNAKELVKEGVTGWVIGDPDNPSKELMRAIDCSPEERASMGEAARQLATADFDAKSVAVNLLQQLHQYAVSSR